MITAVTASVGDTVLDSGTKTQRQRERQVCPGVGEQDFSSLNQVTTDLRSFSGVN